MARYSPNMNVMMKAVEKASRHLLRDFGEVENLQISMKGPGDFVSAADKRSEEVLHEELSKARPDYGFLMEESGEIKGKDSSKRFIIDPLDGTSNFINAIPHWCITVALEEDNEITAALTYDPIRDEMFWAERGIGAFMKHQRLRVSGKKKDFFLALSSWDSNMFSRFDKVGDYRMFGATALDLAYIAAGRYDGTYSGCYSPWDVAAGKLLIQEAGGFITQPDKNLEINGSKELIAGNQPCYDALMKAYKV